jgi:hypothetical protein
MDKVKSEIPPNVVAYLLKARTVEPKKQPFLDNGSVYIPTTDTHATIQALLEQMSSTRSVQRGYKEGNWGNLVNSECEPAKKRDQLDGNRRSERTSHR